MIGCGNCHQKHESIQAVKDCHAEACYWATCNHKACIASAEERWEAGAAAEAAAERRAEQYWEEGTAAQQMRRFWEDDREAMQF